MEIQPAYDDFAASHERGENQALYTVLPADLETPVSLMLKLTGAARNSFLLESVTGGEIKGRYSALGMKPDLIWRCVGDKAWINRAARYDEDAFESEDIAGVRFVPLLGEEGWSTEAAEAVPPHRLL